MSLSVKVYVEGSSDILAMQALLEPLITRKLAEGVAIEFFETPPGHRKESLLLKVPAKAVRILQNDSQAIVAAIPDLYPLNQGFPHTTAEELINGLHDQFGAACKKVKADTRLRTRFKAFCFKHDLEVLILAAEEALALRLRKKDLERAWTVPVEDQNNDNPPKHIVEALFQEVEEIYDGAIDAPLILKNANYTEIAARCPQCFKPFVEFLDSVGDA